MKSRIIKEKVIALSYDNLAKMIKYIETEFKMTFDLKQEEFNQMIEVTNIRNILVHNRGLVNERFLNNVGVINKSYELNQKITINPDKMSYIANFFNELVSKLHASIIEKFSNNESDL